MRRGLAQGRDEGLELALLTAIDDLLEARGILNADVVLERLAESKDHELLRRAVIFAGTVSSLREFEAELWPKRRSRRR